MRRILGGAQAVRVYASGGMDVNHLDETYMVNGVNRRPDIIDNAYVVVDFENGVRGHSNVKFVSITVLQNKLWKCMWHQFMRKRERLDVKFVTTVVLKRDT